MLILELFGLWIVTCAVMAGVMLAMRVGIE